MHYFISDAHIRTDNNYRARLLIKFLRDIKSKMTHLYILGDLFEFWFEYNLVFPKDYFKTLATLYSLIQDGKKVHYVLGNHEVMIGDFLKNFGFTVHSENTVLNINGKRVFLAHGNKLDKRFFESLKIWVGKLSEVKFDLDEQTKIENIIHLLNKFIFIQTLDDFFVIDARWIKTNWDEMERKWKAKGKYQVLKKYFDEIDNWFYEYYDTELFRGNILEHVKMDETNIEKLYNSLQIVLGVTGWQTTFRGIAGVMQYNFRFIDEDIFGKACNYLFEFLKEFTKFLVFLCKDIYRFNKGLFCT